ncbi:MAG: hypothetical protein ABI948_13110 [Thermoleophilia bacterium]
MTQAERTAETAHLARLQPSQVGFVLERRAGRMRCYRSAEAAAAVFWRSATLKIATSLPV